MIKFSKFISALLVVFAIISIPAFADDMSTVSGMPSYNTSTQQTFSIGTMPSEQWDFTLNRPLQFSPPKQIITEDTLEVANPLGTKVYDEPNDPLPKTQAENTIYGPYSSVDSLDVSKWMVIVDDAIMKNAVLYSGQQCFEFSNGTTTIFVRCDAFSKSTSDSNSLSSVLTIAANNRDTSKKRGYAYESYLYYYNGMPVYRWSIVIASGEFHTAGNDLSLRLEIEDSVSVDFYAFNTDVEYSSFINLSPTLGFKTTNTGGVPDSYYADFSFNGRGNTPTTTSIGSILTFGVSALKFGGQILASSLTPMTFAELLASALSLSNTSDRQYSSGPNVEISNPYNNEYIYEIMFPIPFTITELDDYAQLEVRCDDIVSNSAEFSVTCTYSVT